MVKYSARGGLHTVLCNSRFSAMVKSSGQRAILVTGWAGVFFFCLFFYLINLEWIWTVMTQYLNGYLMLKFYPSSVKPLKIYLLHVVLSRFSSAFFSGKLEICKPAHYFTGTLANHLSIPEMLHDTWSALWVITHLHFKNDTRTA